MNIVQVLRRIEQSSGNGWSKSFDMQSAQIPLIEKLYANNGLEIKMTCGACPEQYEIFRNGEQVAYYRLRHGEFRVDFPDCGGETIYHAEPNGDGIFDDNERLKYLSEAMKAVITKINLSKI